MAKKSVTINKNLAGIVVAVIGAVLVYWGYRTSNELVSQAYQALHGRPTNEVIGFYVMGCVLVFIGIIWTNSKKKR